jgi:hypothetical protein
MSTYIYTFVVFVFMCLCVLVKTLIFFYSVTKFQTLHLITTSKLFILCIITLRNEYNKNRTDFCDQNLEPKELFILNNKTNTFSEIHCLKRNGNYTYQLCPQFETLFSNYRARVYIYIYSFPQNRQTDSN